MDERIFYLVNLLRCHACLNLFQKLIFYKNFPPKIFWYKFIFYFCKKIIMKQILIALLLTFSFFACTEDCKNCKSVTTNLSGDSVIQEGSTNKYCDSELDEKESEEPVTVGNQTTKWVCE